MATYIKKDKEGNIVSFATWEFPDSEKVDYEVVHGYDGKLYKADEAPVKSQEMIDEENFSTLRLERDNKLRETDYLMTVDKYAELSDDDKTAITEYRQALRDLPGQDGAPWDGGKENTPWPTKPDVK